MKFTDEQRAKAPHAIALAEALSAAGPNAVTYCHSVAIAREMIAIGSKPTFASRTHPDDMGDRWIVDMACADGQRVCSIVRAADLPELATQADPFWSVPAPACDQSVA